MTLHDIVIKNGHLILPDGVWSADLGITGETIAALGTGLAGKREIDAMGQYVIPGAVDAHTHLTDPTMPPYDIPTADSFYTAGIAAAFGGTTTLVDFAQAPLGRPLTEELHRRHDEADREAVVDFSLHLTLRDPAEERLAEFEEVFAFGVTSLKLFMAYEGYWMSDTAILRAMERLAELGGVAVVHPEHWDIVQELRRRVMVDGRVPPMAHAGTIPPDLEGSAIRKALTLAAISGVRVLICHISCAEGVRQVELAKAVNQDAWGETCPQYLALTRDEYAQDNERSQGLCITPPLRDAAHHDHLLQGLAAGGLDLVSTDHNPRAIGANGIRPAGSSSVETRLAIVHHRGVRQSGMSLPRWVQVCCTNPADALGMAKKGRLLPGCDADVVLFDPQRRIRFSPETLHSPIDFSSYEGMEVQGFPTLTISRGTVVVEDGQFVGQKGRGRFVRRRPGARA